MAADPPESSGRSKAVLTTRLKTDRTPPSMEKSIVSLFGPKNPEFPGKSGWG